MSHKKKDNSLTIDSRYKFFCDLLLNSQRIYSWTFEYDHEALVLDSNCDNEDLSNIFIYMTNQFLNENGNDLINDTPAVITNSLGLAWIMEKHTVKKDKFIYYTIGPTLYSEITLEKFSNWMLSQFQSVRQANRYLAQISGLQVFPVTQNFNHATMLHFTLTGQTISWNDLSNINYATEVTTSSPQADSSHKESLHKGNWELENYLMRFIEDGDINYKDSINGRINMDAVPNLGDGTPLRTIKNWIIIYTALCTRAAIRGGLDAETAYTLSDGYINSAEKAKSLSELTNINDLMIEDFIQRVHQTKLKNGVSNYILKCCNYIDLHLSEKISVGSLAESTGYSPNYLSKKFEKEMGITISAYIKEKRMEEAKNLLKTSNLSLQEISDRLCYSSQSHFGDQFKKATGYTPNEYRSKIKSE